METDLTTLSLQCFLCPGDVDRMKLEKSTMFSFELFNFVLFIKVTNIEFAMKVSKNILLIFLTDIY